MKWFKCSEQTPPREPILTTDGKKQHVAYPNFDSNDGAYYTGSGENCYYCGGTPRCHYKVTHKIYENDYLFTYWMPLPNPPNEVDEPEKILTRDKEALDSQWKFIFPKCIPSKE